MESFNKVTTLSKIIAAVLFVVLPFLGFWLGYNYGFSMGQGATLLSQSILTPTVPVSDVPTANKVIYTDPNLGFSLEYDDSWGLDAQNGTYINDNSGRTVSLTKEGNKIEIMAQKIPSRVGACGGMIEEDEKYEKFQVDGVAIWRLNFAQSLDEEMPWIDIVTPDGLDTYTCSMEIEGKLFSIRYAFDGLTTEPNSQYYRDLDVALLDEMDQIIKSINW